MSSNKKWYDNLSIEDKEILKAKRRRGALIGSKKAAELTIQTKLDRLKNIHLIPWSNLTQKEKRYCIASEQDNKCLECGISEIWNNKPLKFDLDHIDGNRENNERINLRFLCPNCHSQTPTFKVGNNKNPGKIVYTDQEIIESLLANTSGYKAMKAINMNPHGGNYTRIRNIIKLYNIDLNYTV